MTCVGVDSIATNLAEMRLGRDRVHAEKCEPRHFSHASVTAKDFSRASWCMQLEWEHPRECGEIAVRRQDGEPAAESDRAEQKVRVRTLHTNRSATIETCRRVLELVGAECAMSVRPAPTGERT